MKTAMQELMDKVQSINERYELKEDANWLMNEIIDLIENSLEKEKEQIIEARDGSEISSFTTGKDYYDLNFNHHIESEPNTYTNFTPHNANAVAEYNEGLKNFTPDNANAVAEYNNSLTNFSQPKQINKMETPLQNLKYYFRNDETITKEELLTAIDELIDNERAFFCNAFEHGYASSGLVAIEQNKAFEAYGKLYNACNP
jgi:hypothetical protein